MASSLADELLADLGPEEDEQGIDAQQHNISSKANGKRKAIDADLDDLGALGGEEDGEAAEGQGENGHKDGAGDDIDEDEEEGTDEDAEEDSGDGGGGTNGQANGRAPGVNPDSKHAVKAAEELDEEEVNKLDLAQQGSIHAVSKLLRSSKLQDALAQIDEFGAHETPDLEGVLEETPEYHLIVRANNLAVEVDNEILIAHKFIRDHYAPRFPELEQLIPNPWEFVRAVQALGNEEDMLKANLEGILPHGTIVVISMTASTTSGRPLSADAWEKVQEACKVVFDLEAARRKILAYVESRMTLIAPNLSALLGTRVATKLLGVSGGLTALSKIAACNVGLLGAPKKAATAATGLSTTFSGRHEGFITQSDLVQNTAEEYRRQAQRMVSAKCTLATRMDAAQSNRDGSYGRKLYEELEKKLEKLQEPPPSKMTKALPIPKEGGRKQRRGGRLARKRKEMYGMTELRKMQNRVEFGKAEEEAGAFDDILGMGMIGSASSGKIRAAVTGEARSKAKMSKRNLNRLAALRGPSASSSLDSATAGTASSLSFTPVQGIELVDPSRRGKTGAQAQVDEANQKWFRQGQFSLLPTVGGAGASQIPSKTGSNGGMAPPPVPVKKEK